MENTEQNQVTPEDAEITALQARLEDARKKKAALLDAQQAKALSDAQAVRLREQERSAIAAAEAARVEQYWREKRAAEAKVLQDGLAADKAEQVRAEQEFSRLEEIRRANAARDAELKRLDDLAAMEEAENNRIVAELARQSSPAVEGTPAAQGVVDETNGRSLLFSRMIKPATSFDGMDGHHVEAAAPVERPSRVESNEIRNTVPRRGRFEIIAHRADKRRGKSYSRQAKSTGQEEVRDLPSD